MGSRGDSVWCTFRNFFSVTFILPTILERGVKARVVGRQSERPCCLRCCRSRQKQHHLALSLCSLVAADADLLFTPLHRAASNGHERTGLLFCSSWFSRSSGLFTHFSQYGSHRGGGAALPLIGAVQLTHTHTHSNHTRPKTAVCVCSRWANKGRRLCTRDGWSLRFL